VAAIGTIHSGNALVTSSNPACSGSARLLLTISVVMGSMTRRAFLSLGCAAWPVGCTAGLTGQSPGASRLRARPRKTIVEPAAVGQHPLALGTPRDGLLYVPREIPARGAPLVVLMHGATGSGRGVTSRIDAFAVADRFKAVVLAPDSRGTTWDVILSGFGPDVTFLDNALEHTFAHVPIDSKRVAIGGFSDGASYALSLGVANGDLFTHVMAFSPGFFVAGATRGLPEIFVSHGTRDEILSINSTRRRLVPALKNAGYVVRYREFDGPHTVPANIVEEAFEWMIGR
jgi:phospholipase/carboxylesterase